MSSGEVTIFCFASLLNGGLPSKEIICSLRSKLFPLIVEPLLEGVAVHGSKQEVPKVVPLYRNGGKNMVVYPNKCCTTI